MNTSTPWSCIPVSAGTLPYLRGTHSLWSRLFNGEQIFTALPNNQKPGDNDGGCRGIDVALQQKGLITK